MLDNLVTEWAQNNDWMTNRSEKGTMEEKRNFVTFALDKMKLCTFHRKGKGTGKGKEKLSKVPRNLGPADTVVYVRPDCTTAQLKHQKNIGAQLWWEQNLGDSKWVNVDFTVGGKHQKNIGAILMEAPASMVGAKSCETHRFERVL